MKLLSPHWVHHDEKPIFSVDIHGNKFATGGQGNDCGRVVIWNLLPVLSEKAEMDKSIPKLLCQMDNHLACVNVVRWSYSGQMLASGADDKLVMIFKRSSKSSTVFGSGGGTTKNTENWRVVHTLRAHSGDVLDLAWSSQDRWLASCSVDNTVIVWDGQKFPTILATLKGHTGLVKGVTWDPVGKFLASQSDDRTVRFWKTSDWSCQTCIKEPFEECGGTTHILRLSWSPDGQYIVSAHAMNGGGPTAKIIEREGWKCDKDFVGHRKAVTCVRFHSSILKQAQQSAKKSQQYCCLAMGSRDRSLSVWSTAFQRPLVVIHDLFQDSVLDLTWSTDGHTLLACSGDGTIACLQFTNDELGTALSCEDKNALYQRMYGKGCNLDVTVHNDKDVIIENSELLHTAEKANKPPTFPVNGLENGTEQVPPLVQKPVVPVAPVSAPSLQQPPASPARPIHKQIETRTKDGKRRITPMFIPMSEDGPNEAPVAEFSSSTRNTSEIVIEKVVEVSGAVSSMKPPSAFQPEHQKTEPTADEQKKLDSRLSKVAPVKTTAALQTIPQTAPLVSTPSSISQRSAPTAFSAGKATAYRQPVTRSAGVCRVQVQNEGSVMGSTPLARLFCVNANAMDKKNWELFIGSPVNNMNACAKFVVTSSVDGTIRIFDTKTGDSILPILNITSPAVLSAFSPNNGYLGVLTESGTLRVWNLNTRSIYLNVSCTDILSGAFANMLHISDTRLAFIGLSNGCSYSYSQDLSAWLVLASRDPIIRNGLLTSNLPQMSRNMKTYPIMSMQSTGLAFNARARNATNDLAANSSDCQHAAKVSFIENQIRLCETLASVEELKYWYAMLGFQMAQGGMETEKRVRQVLDELLGQSFSGSSGDGEKVLGITKHSLLEIVLENFNSNPTWQRIYMEYQQQLEDMKKFQALDAVKMDTV